MAEPNVLRIVCEEIDVYDTFLGRVMIIQQVSPDELTGSKMLRRGRFEETPTVPFTLTTFDADALGDGPIIARSDNIISSHEPIFGPYIGEGYVFWDYFAFNYWGESRTLDQGTDDKIKISFTVHW